jgi:hypothetical protein
MLICIISGKDNEKRSKIRSERRRKKGLRRLCSAALSHTPLNGKVTLPFSGSFRVAAIPPCQPPPPPAHPPFLAVCLIGGASQGGSSAKTGGTSLVIQFSPKKHQIPLPSAAREFALDVFAVFFPPLCRQFSPKSFGSCSEVARWALRKWSVAHPRKGKGGVAVAP